MSQHFLFVPTEVVCKAAVETKVDLPDRFTKNTNFVELMHGWDPPCDAYFTSIEINDLEVSEEAAWWEICCKHQLLGELIPQDQYVKFWQIIADGMQSQVDKDEANIVANSVLAGRRY